MVPSRSGARAHRSAVLAGLILAGGLAACSNGVEAGTLDPPSATGVQVDVAELHVRNAVIVAGEDGGLAVSLTVVNSGLAEDAITGLDATSDGETISGRLTPRSITLAPQTATVVSPATEATIELELDISAGGYVPVTLYFEHAGSAELSLPVITDRSPYGGGTG